VRPTKTTALMHLSILASLGCSGATPSAIPSGPMATEQIALVTMTDGVTIPEPSGACSKSNITDAPSSANYALDMSSATISGDMLKVAVSEEDGCATSDAFYACWPPTFLAELPPGTVVYLVRTPQKCSTQPTTHTVIVNLDPLRTAYVKVFGPNDNGTKWNNLTLEGGIALGLVNPSMPGKGIDLNYSWPYADADGGSEGGSDGASE
jgi:hypothetical protein